MNTITLFIIFIPILVVILLLANLLFAVHRPDSEKVTPYECGFSPVYGQTRNPMSIQFYLVGILFLIFDLEILFIYPYRSIAYQSEAYGFWIVMIFFIILTVGFVYEFGSGRLYFTDKRSQIKNPTVETVSNPSPFSFRLSNHSKSESWNKRNMTYSPTYQTVESGSFFKFKSIFGSSLSESYLFNFKQKSRSISTFHFSLNKRNYFNTVYAKDDGLPTNNPHIEARRHITSNQITTREIVVSIQNKVCEYANKNIGTVNTPSINQVEDLISIKPSYFIQLDDSIPKSQKIISTTLGFVKNLPFCKRKRGVYIWTNMKTGDQLVGSSLNLRVRVKNYLYPNYLQNSPRPFRQDIKKNELSSYQLTIYVVKDGYNKEEIHQVLSDTLCLEQYYILSLNSTFNTIKVRGRLPPTFTKSIKRQEKRNLRKSKPIEIYYEDVPDDKRKLIYVTKSWKEFTILAKCSSGTIRKYLKEGLLFNKLQITVPKNIKRTNYDWTKLDRNNIYSQQDIIKLFDKLREEYKKSRKNKKRKSKSSLTLSPSLLP